MTQDQLVDTLGLTSVHLNRTLQQLRSEGLVETGSRMVSLPDVPRFRGVAEFDAAYLHAGAGDELGRRPATA